MRRTFVFEIIALALFVSCAPKSNSFNPNNKPYDYPPSFKVSVATGGNEITDFENKLIHRVSITQDIANSFAISHASWLPEIQLYREFDGNGKIKGMRISKGTATTLFSTLGLQLGDTLTAANREPFRNSEQFVSLIKDLLRDKNGSLTLERNGTPHKVLIYLNP